MMSLTTGEGGGMIVSLDIKGRESSELQLCPSAAESSALGTEFLLPSLALPEEEVEEDAVE